MSVYLELENNTATYLWFIMRSGIVSPTTPQLTAIEQRIPANLIRALDRRAQWIEDVWIDAIGPLAKIIFKEF